MLKNFGLQVRLPGKDHAAFMSHWIGVHAPLSAGVAGVRGYVINEVLADVSAPGLPAVRLEPSLDGIAQLWFDSPAAMQQVAQTPEAKRWFSDGANYLGARTGIASAERALRKPATPRAVWKLVLFQARDAALDPTQFRQRWQWEFGERVAALAGLAGHVQSDVTAINPATNMPSIAIDAVDGIDELWVASEARARELARELARLEGVGGSRLFSATRALLARETVIIPPPF